MNNNYYYLVYFKKENKQKKYSFIQTDNELLKYLKSQKDNIVITCNCRNKVPLKISNTEKPYIYPSKKNMKHDKDCIRSPFYEPHTPYEKGWKFNHSLNKHTVRLSFFSEIEDKFHNNLSNNIYKYDKTTNKDYVTCLGFVQKLNLMAWESMIKKREKIPKTHDEFMKYVYIYSEHIHFENKRNNLQHYFYKNEKVKDVKPLTDIFFVYMEFNKIEKIYDNMTLISVKNNFGSIKKFYVDSKKLKFYLDMHKSKTTLISGFIHRVNKNHASYFTFIDFVLIPITQNGLFIKNKHDELFFKKLLEDGCLFFKAYLPLQEYRYSIPKYFILRKDEKPIVCDYFLNENEKKQKLYLAKTKQFREYFGFLYEDYFNK